MKSYEEMTENVLLRAKKERTVLKKKRLTIAAAALCLCLVAAAVFATVGADGQRGDPNREPRLSVFAISASAEEQKQKMPKDVAVPYNAVLRIHNIAGMGAKQMLALEQADREYAEKMAEESNNTLSGSPQWAMTTWTTDKLLITSIYAGCYYIAIDDYDQVRDVVVQTTGIGSVNTGIADLGDEDVKDCISITWCVSDEGVELFEKNPDMKMSYLKDTISVTVLFKDGASETVLIDITLDDEGQIYGTFCDLKIE